LLKRYAALLHASVYASVHEGGVRTTAEKSLHMVSKDTHATLAADLGEVVGTTRVSTAAADRLAAARDLWPRALLGVRFGNPAPEPPALVVWPETPKQVVAVVRWAMERKVGLVPYGGGSGLCGGAMPFRDQVVVDLKRLKRIEWIHAEDHLVRVQAGMLGYLFERELGRHGLTLGHFPSSIFCSTVGGWVAARSAGQLSSKYGNIEDMVASLQVVTGNGDLWETRPHPASGLGPDPTHLFVGCEGTLGIITAATLRVRRKPPVEKYCGYAFSRMSAGMEAMRRVMQRGLRPAVMRLYDEFDTFLVRSSVDMADLEGKGEPRGVFPAVLRRLTRAGEPFLPFLRETAFRAAVQRPRWFNRLTSGLITRATGGGCLMILGHVGDAQLVEAERDRCGRELEAAGGVALGERTGNHWHRHRHAVAFLQSEVFRAHGFVDTLETAVTWDKAFALYEAVKRAVSPQAFVMAHIGHVYPEGCALCFTFAGQAAEATEAMERYDQTWKEGLAAVSRAGGTISHHHGVGQSRTRFMVEEHGDALALLEVFKQTLDPHGVLNPGKLKTV
jgi:alkyldihydroxyacetonephosphate synthase